MNTVQEEWEKMRIAYQNRYAKMYKRIKENEFNTDNHGALLEMSYVLITVFGLTDNQVQEIERNDGFTNTDVKQGNDDFRREARKYYGRSIWKMDRRTRLFKIPKREMVRL